jgi:hypothetical protein
VSDLVLRLVGMDDANALDEAFTEVGVARYLFDDCLLSREETQKHVEAARSHAGWAICVEGAVVGLVALRPVDAVRD